jgi:cytochrome P450
MHRFVREDITLSDGTVLPGGSRFMVQDRLMDPDVYDEPEKFKLRRFVDKREMPDQSNSWQHATVSTFHMAFGYGHYACPGRFIASNVLKMALSNLLMKYDWKLADYEGPRSLDIETAQIIHPEMMLQLRRRTEEIKVDVPI